MNACILEGRITKDLNLAKTSSGQSVVSFTLAVDRDYKKEGQPTADFLNMQAWAKNAEIICKYCCKGALINTLSHAQNRTYDDKEGRKVYITEFIVDKVKFIDTRKAKSVENAGQQSTEYEENTDGTLDISSDDLPF